MGDREAGKVWNPANISMGMPAGSIRPTNLTRCEPSLFVSFVPRTVGGLQSVVVVRHVLFFACTLNQRRRIDLLENARSCILHCSVLAWFGLSLQTTSLPVDYTDVVWRSRRGKPGLSVAALSSPLVFSQNSKAIAREMALSHSV
jgi:hypothetical protein